MNKQAKGFTLVELLVVISVVGILASVVLVTFTGSQKQARDTQRKSDLKQYQTALENFANRNNGLYPSRTSSVDPNTLCTVAILNITGCPSDPKAPTQIYRYLSDGTGSPNNNATVYSLWASLENVTSSTYWILCSNGKAGSGATAPTSGNLCPI